MARRIRSTARSISRSRKGSCRSSMPGLRNRATLPASRNPRWNKISAATRGSCRSSVNGAGWAGKTQRLVVGIETAATYSVAGIRIVVVHRKHGADLLAGVEEVLIPVRPRLIDIEVGVVPERKFERAGGADMPFGLCQPQLEFPPFFAGEVGLLQFLHRFVEFVFGQFSGCEQNQFFAGLAGRIKKRPVVRAPFTVPTDNRESFQTSRMTPEDSEIRHLEVFENFDLECFEIEIHRCQYSPVPQAQPVVLAPTFSRLRHKYQHAIDV